MAPKLSIIRDGMAACSSETARLWSCPALVDRLAMRRVLVMDAGARSYGGAVVEGGVATLAVVEDLDEVEYGAP